MATNSDPARQWEYINECLVNPFYTRRHKHLLRGLEDAKANPDKYSEEDLRNMCIKLTLQRAGLWFERDEKELTKSNEPRYRQLDFTED